MSRVSIPDPPSTGSITYKASPTLSLFHNDKSRRRGIMGPVGSGKSSASCIELMRRMQSQKPFWGKRRTRFAVIRNTYRQLEDTTIKTWREWFVPQAFGHVNTNDMTHIINEGNIECEVLFRALDRPDHVANVLSLELTGAWINEAREVPLPIIEAVDDRCGRFPPRREGGCTWRGVIMDTNPPDDDHWWYNMAETERPPGWAFFSQPGGLIEKVDEDGRPLFLPNPEAENLENLEENFYEERAQGKSHDHIRVYYCGKYGFVREGKPVIPEFSDQAHVALRPIEPNPFVAIRMGVDWGLTPACIMAQLYPSGNWVWFREICADGMGAKRFGEQLVQIINNDYHSHTFLDRAWGDPAGRERSQADEQTPFQIINKVFKDAGINISFRPAPTQDPILRRESVAVPLGRFIDGKPGLVISPDMKTTRKGLNGGYCYKRMKVTGERYADRPEKNKYSHPIEAGQYLMLGGGEGISLIRRSVKKPSSRQASAKVASGSWMTH